MQISDYFFLFFTVFAAGSIGFFVQKNTQFWLQIFLSFSGAYIFGITMLHLLPEVFAKLSEEAGYWILLGFFIQLLLEQISRGVEHGHFHLPHQPSGSFAVQIMTGLCVHAFFEGIPLSNIGDSHLFYGIILHHAPAAFALVVLFLSSKYTPKTAFFCLLLFSFMPPLGATIGANLQLSDVTEHRIISVVIGSFLHIATTILFEVDSSGSASNHHQIPWRRLLAIAVGIATAAAIS